jgi:hypothetical protein
MSTTIYFASNVTRMLDRADAALVSPAVRPPLSQLAFRVDQSRLGASRSTRTETNHDSNRAALRRSTGSTLSAERDDDEIRAAMERRPLTDEAIDRLVTPRSVRLRGDGRVGRGWSSCSLCSRCCPRTLVGHRRLETKNHRN